MKKFLAFRQIVDHLGATVASKFTPLASIFVYSRYMTIEDYGVVNLFSSYLWIFGIAMSLNLHAGVGRFIYANLRDFPSCFSTSLFAIGFLFLSSSALVLANLGTFEELLGLPRAGIMLMLVIVLGSILEALFAQIAIFEQNSALLLRVSLAKALGTCALAVLLLFLLTQDKYMAVLYADAAANLLLIGFVLFRLRASFRLTFNVGHLRYVAHYAMPLIPYMLSLTLLAQFDRVMIDGFFGKEVTGLYSLAYNAGILLQMLVTAVLNVFNPSFFESLRQRDYARVARDSSALFGLAVVVTTLLVLFGAEIFSWLVPSKYGVALDLIPIVALGGLSFTTFQIWVRVIAYANRTYLISIIAVTASILNISLNAWLLPLFGYKIAAVTTVLAYLAMSLLCVWVLNRFIGLLKVNVWPELGHIALLAATLMFFRWFELGDAVEVPLKLALLALCAWHFRGSLLVILRWKPLLAADAA